MAGPGRPKKHAADELHFKTDAPDEAVVENPIVNAEPQSETIDNLFPVITPSLSQDIQSDADMESRITDNTAPSNAISTESPIEEKIHQLVEEASLQGWMVIQTAHLGVPIKVTDDINSDGIIAIFKRTRSILGKRWAETGKWINYMNGVDIPFEPLYWRPRF